MYYFSSLCSEIELDMFFFILKKIFNILCVQGRGLRARINFGFDVIQIQ